MENMKYETLIKKYFKKNYPFIIFGAIFLSAHFFFPVTYDDAQRVIILSDMSFSDMLHMVNGLSMTSPRFFTYVIVHFLLWLPYGKIWWSILDSLVILVIWLSLANLFDIEGKKKWLIIVLFCMYPYQDMGSAGFISTTVGYLWVLAALLVMLVIFREVFSYKKLRWYQYFIYFLMLLYGTNQEQTCVIFSIFFFGSLLYIKGKTYLRQFIVIISSLLICGINAKILFFNGAMKNRIVEDYMYFPDFEMMSFVDKMELGLTTSIQCILTENILFVAFLLLVCYLIWKKFQSSLFRTMAVIPLIISILARVECKESHFYEILNSEISRTGTISTETYFNKVAFLPLSLMLLVCGMTIINLWFLTQEWRKSLLMSGILVLGAVSRIVLGFAPSVWPLRTRTFIFLWFAIIMVFIYLWIQNYHSLIEPEINKYLRLKKSMECLMFSIAFIMFLNNFLGIFLC